MKTIKAWAVVQRSDGKLYEAFPKKEEALFALKRISLTPKELKVVEVEITIKD